VPSTDVMTGMLG